MRTLVDKPKAPTPSPEELVWHAPRMVIAAVRQRLGGATG